MGLLGGAMAAGGMALAVYLSGGSAIESVAAQDVVYFRIGGGAPGSTAYGMAGQLAGTVSNPPGSRQCDGEGACGVEGLLGLAQTTLNPVDSLESLRRGSLEAAIISGDVADAALRGTGAFKKSGAMADLRAIANIGAVTLHILVPKESKATDVKSLAGKRVAVGLEDSDNAVTARVLLRAAGLPDKKTKFILGEIPAAARELLTGEVDALAVVDQMPSSEVAILMATGDYRLLSAEVTAKDVPNYIFAEWITDAQYPGVASVRALAVPTVLAVRADLPGQIAGGLVRALWHSANPATPGTATGSIAPDMSRASVPWHPEAASAFTELSNSTPAALESPAPTN